MDTVIRFKVQKDLEYNQYNSLLRLKGSIIAKGFTDIIHIGDEDENFHINSFSVLTEQKTAILEYMTHYLKEEGLEHTVAIVL